MAARKKAKKKAGKKKSSPKEMLLVGSKTKAAMKTYNVNVSGDCLEALNEVVYWYIDQAAKRTTANGRKTVRGHDFLSC